MKLNVTPRCKHAFSLVELSIVLVVLGLLVGGVLGGKSLIKAAELRSISTQYNQFYTATKTFRDKYFALPGDMNNATQFWGIAGGTGSDATCKTTVSTDSRTCNGNGDGTFDIYAGSEERMRFWQHLANAGLITGTYQGVDVATITANDAPSGKLKNTYWQIYFYGKVGSGAWDIFQGDYGNTIDFGAACGSKWVCWGLLPEEAWNIDQKLDDGKPGTGKIMASGGNNGITACTDAVTDTTAAANAASYALSTTTPECALIFRQQF